MLDSFDLGSELDTAPFDETGAELAFRWPAEDLIELEEEAGEDEVG